MMGLGHFSIGAQTRSVWRFMISMGPQESMLRMSPPAANTVSPPVRTMQRTLASALSAVKVVDSAACRDRLSAFVA